MSRPFALFKAGSLQITPSPNTAERHGEMISSPGVMYSLSFGLDHNEFLKFWYDIANPFSLWPDMGAPSPAFMTLWSHGRLESTSLTPKDFNIHFVPAEIKSQFRFP